MGPVPHLAQPQPQTVPKGRQHLDLRNQLVLDNLHLAAYVASQHRRRGVAMDDLLQEARRGLIEAAERFDPSRGYKFCTYAVWKCRSFVLDAIRDQHRVNGVSRKLQRDYTRYAATVKRLRQEGLREPTDDELATALGWTRAQVWQMQIRRHGRRSLDVIGCVLSDNRQPSADFRCRAATAAHRLTDQISYLTAALDHQFLASPTWTKIFRHRYGLADHSLKSRSPVTVAQRFAVTERTVYEAVSRLWRTMYAENLSHDINHRFMLGVRQQIDDFIDLLGPGKLPPYG